MRNQLTHLPPASSPTTSVVAECLRIQATVPPNNAVQRLFGVSPLGRDAEPWYVVTLGEPEVGRRLGALGHGWYVLHSVPVGTGSSDLDHVVIGPAGVFTITTKHHRGQHVWVGGRRILVSGQRTDHLRNAKYEAKRTSQLLSVAARALIDVTPIIAIVGAKTMTVRERPTDVAVLRETELSRWLQRHPATLMPAKVQQLAALAAQPATWKRMPEPEEVDHGAFERLRHAVERARRTRLGPGRNRDRRDPLGFVAALPGMVSTLPCPLTGSRRRDERRDPRPLVSESSAGRDIRHPLLPLTPQINRPSRSRSAAACAAPTRATRHPPSPGRWACRPAGSRR
ncbi:nuclease-related domain-containing protein [Agromyces bauzanensis]